MVIIEQVHEFERIDKNQIISALVIGDTHSEYMDVDAFFKILSLVKKIPKIQRRLILIGDIFDMEAFVTKLDSYKEAKRKREFDNYFIPEIKKEYEWFEWFLYEISKYIPTEHIYFIEGNHEQRLYRPAFKKIIPHDCLYWFDLPCQLKFKKRGIKFIKYNDWLRIKTLKDKLLITHGQLAGQNPIDKHFKIAHCPIMFGHTHEIGSKSFKTVEKTLVCFNNPCLCGVSPEYLEGRVTNWNVGFHILTITYENIFIHPFEFRNRNLFDYLGRKI